MKDKKYKILAGILTVIICVCLGCEKEEAVYLTSVDENAETVQQDEEVAEDSSENMPVSEKRKILVHICGAVKKPGVYELTEDERIYHAVEKAGGFAEEADSDYLNQAQKLTDGMQVYIPTEEEVLKHLESGGAKEIGIRVDETDKTGIKTENAQSPATENLVNINTATKEELCTLSGIGEGKAQKIIEYRTEAGNYRSIEEIMNVDGIKQGLFDKIKDSITVS